MTKGVEFPKAIASNGAKPEEGFAVGIRRGSEDATGVDAALTRLIEAKQIENEMTDDGEIGAGIFHASAHLVVVQSQIGPLLGSRETFQIYRLRQCHSHFDAFALHEVVGSVSET